VVSKLPGIPEDCADVAAWITAAVEASLQRLRLPRLDGLLLHQPMQLIGRNGTVIYETMRALQRRGQVDKIGVSVYGPAEIEELCRTYRFDLVQAPASILDRRLLNSGWVARLASQGVELHLRSVFLQGLLLMPRTELPPGFARWDPLWDIWHSHLRDSGQSALQACLRYAVAMPNVHRIVVGVDGLTHLQEILQAAAGDGLTPPSSLHADDDDLLNPGRWPR